MENRPEGYLEFEPAFSQEQLASPHEADIAAIAKAIDHCDYGAVKALVEVIISTGSASVAKFSSVDLCARLQMHDTAATSNDMRRIATYRRIVALLRIAGTARGTIPPSHVDARAILAILSGRPGAIGPINMPALRAGSLRELLRPWGLGGVHLGLSPQLSGGSVTLHRQAVMAAQRSGAVGNARLLTSRRGLLGPHLAHVVPMHMMTATRCSILRHVCWNGDEVGLHLALALLFVFSPCATLPWGKKSLLSHVLHEVKSSPGAQDVPPWLPKRRPRANSASLPPHRRRMLHVLLSISGPLAPPMLSITRHPGMQHEWKQARWYGSAIRHPRGQMLLHRRKRCQALEE